MRFFRWPLARAIPELDPLPRDRAAAFVRAARKGWKRRLARAGLVLLSAVVSYMSFACLFALALLVGGESVMYRIGALPLPVRISLLGIVLFVVVLTAVAAHRWQVIRAVRIALAERGRCRCGYTIAGQTLDERLAVRCPECACETVADADLGEVDDHGETKRYLPRHPQVPPLLTKKRLARAAGTMLVLFFAGGFVAAAWWGVNRWLRTKDAQFAAQERPSPQEIADFVLASQPAGSEAGEDGYQVLRTLLAQISQVEAAVRSDWPEGPTYGDYSMVEAPSYLTASRSAAQVKEDDATIELATRYLRAHAQKGTWETMKRLAACRRAVRPVPAADLSVVATAILPEMAAVRQVARINAARMRVAIKAGDAAEFSDAFEANLALSRILALQPTLIDRLVSLAIEAMTLQLGRSALATHAEPPWLDGIERALAVQRVDVPVKRSLQGERYFSLDAAAAGVIARAEGRAGGGSPASGLSPNVSWGGLWWGSGHEAINRVYDAEEARAAQERFERTPFSASSTGVEAADLLGPGLEKAISSSDQMVLERRGLVVMLALERYRIAHGSYPPTLNQLVPHELPGLPLDPWTGKSFGYRRIDAAADARHRGYLLWSFGLDGVDNNAKPPAGPNSYGPLFNADAAGTDYIINDIER